MKEPADTDYLRVAQLRDVLAQDHTIEIPGETRARIEQNRRYLEKKIAEPNSRHYGINTGFGSLCNVPISPDELDLLQENLVLSHACGMGEEVLPEVVRLMVFLKVRALGLGYSGIRLETVEKLVELYNRNIQPVVWEVGSLGASGDLAPLAHLTLPLLGRGTVRYKGEKRPARDVLSELGISPITLKAKEGLALLNGTQFMSAWGCWSILESRRVCRLADLTAAISIDAFNASTDPFHHAIHRVRPHKGQLEAAA
ncbi:MAG: histidine ammonia-lyase, partial [Spirochaetaceae bacterium]